MDNKTKFACAINCMGRVQDVVKNYLKEEYNVDWVDQITEAMVPLECEPKYGSGETAWAANGGVNTNPFPGKNWATYVEYTVR